MIDREFMQYLIEVQGDCIERYSCNGCNYYTKIGCIFKNIPADWCLDELPAYPQPAPDPRQPITPEVVEEFYKELEEGSGNAPFFYIRFQ